MLLQKKTVCVSFCWIRTQRNTVAGIEAFTDVVAAVVAGVAIVAATAGFHDDVGSAAAVTKVICIDHVADVADAVVDVGGVDAVATFFDIHLILCHSNL